MEASHRQAVGGSEMAERPTFTSVFQVAVVVNDLDEAVRRYADGYGISPWRMYRVLRSDRQMEVREEPRETAFRYALCDLGPMNWELIQPLDDTSIFAEFLQRHGEGVQHVAFTTEDPKAMIEHVRGRRAGGVGVLQSGIARSGDGELTYTFLNTDDDLGVTAELLEFSPGFVRPTPEEIYPPESGDRR
jgi:methylmalonyl-CoA/ethylmalonyl-CoA epimerase